METCKKCGHPANGKYKTGNCAACEEGILLIALENPATTIHGPELFHRLADMVDWFTPADDEALDDGNQYDALMYAKEALHLAGLPRECAHCGTIDNQQKNICTLYHSAFDETPEAITTYCDKDDCNAYLQDNYRICDEGCQREISVNLPENWPDDNRQCCADCIAQGK